MSSLSSADLEAHSHELVPTCDVRVASKEGKEGPDMDEVMIPPSGRAPEPLYLREKVFQRSKADMNFVPKSCHISPHMSWGV